MANTGQETSKNVLLHIIVVGFHHKKGCQIEYAYPPLVDGTKEESGEAPSEWRHLPTLALPDGSHNYNKDTVYFHLRDKNNSKKTVYGVSCYRQMDAKDVVNKTEDITRGTVQKSVCVLTTIPFYGAVAAKLELVTHAWFDQKDFTNTELLRDAYVSLASNLNNTPSNAESEVMIGLNLHDVVKLYRHKILVLFKLIMLERKTVFFMTPVCDLCNVILSVISLFPELLQQGLVESVNSVRHQKLSPTTRELRSGSDHEPFVEIRYSSAETHSDSGDNEDNHDNKLTADVSEQRRWESGDTMSDQLPATFQECATSDDVLERSSSPSQLDMDDSDQPCFDERKSCLTLQDENIDPSGGETTATENKKLTKMKAEMKLNIASAQVEPLRILPVVSPTSIDINEYGFPLAIFTKGSVCHPYLSLSYYDILEDVNIRSFVIGATNVLFKQKRHNVDVIVERPLNISSKSRSKDGPNSVAINDKELAKQLQLTTEDLRFADMVCKHVDENVLEGEFLENTEWEGGDEWIRAQFKDYLLSLMATVLADDPHLIDAFNTSFVTAWKSTHNYRVWRSTVQQLEVIPGHPCQGGVTLNDVKLQLARTERGRKFNAVIDQAGKAVSETTRAVGGAFKSYVSSWWSNLGSPSEDSTS